MKKIKELFTKKNMRIGKASLKKFEEVLFNYAKELADKSIRNAQLSGRKTIKKEDIGG